MMYMDNTDNVTERIALYKCSVCGHIVEVIIEGMDTLVCCGKKMDLMQAKEHDEGAEKHVPVIEKMADGTIVKIGSTPHPMIPEHYIMFIEIISHDNVYVKRKYLEPGESPEMAIKCLNADDITAREYCNIHGLWKNK